MNSLRSYTLAFLMIGLCMSLIAGSSSSQAMAYLGNSVQIDFNQSNSTVVNATLTSDHTSLVINANPTSVTSVSPVSLTASISDTLNSTSTPTGSVSWSDGGAGGTFSASTCILSSGSCGVSYTPSSNPPSTVAITASYGGDTIHQTSSGSSSISISLIDVTSITISPSSTTITSGNVTLTATVADTSNASSPPTGTISWGDGNVGGTFSTSSCTISSNTCQTTYTPSANSPSSVTITASYSGDAKHQTISGTSFLSVNLLKPSAVSVTHSPSTVSSGGSVNFTATVTSSSGGQTTPSGSVSWDDGNAGGTFSTQYCTLSSGSCTVSYASSQNAPNVTTITASYTGDNLYQSSTGSDKLSANVIDNTVITVTPNPAQVSSGTPLTFTATISDAANPSSVIIGLVKWSDNGAGGSFSPDACIVSNNHCSLDYTPPANLSGQITITASYIGDSTHSGSSGSSLAAPASQSSSTSPPQSTPNSVTQSTPPPVSQSSTPPPSPTVPQSPQVTAPAPTPAPSSPSVPTTTPTPAPTTTPPQQQTPPPSQTPVKSPQPVNSPTPSPSTKPSQTNTQQQTVQEIDNAIKKVVSMLESLFDKL